MSNKKIPPAKLLKLFKDLHDAVYYSSKGIAVTSELATLERAFGKRDLHGYRQAINEAFAQYTPKQTINFKKKLRGEYGVAFSEYANKIRENLGPKLPTPLPTPSVFGSRSPTKSPSKSPSKSRTASVARTPRSPSVAASPSVRARSLRPPTPQSSPKQPARKKMPTHPLPALPAKKPLAPPPIYPIPEFLKPKPRKRRKADIHVPAFPAPAAPPPAPRLGPSAPPYAFSEVKTPTAPRLAPLGNVSPSPFMMESNKPSVTPFSFNSPDKKQRALAVGSPQRSFHPSDYGSMFGSPSPKTPKSLSSGIGSIPYKYQITSSPWTPNKTPSAPPDPFRSMPASPAHSHLTTPPLTPLMDRWKRLPLLMGSNSPLDKRRTWKGKKPKSPIFG